MLITPGLVTAFKAISMDNKPDCKVLNQNSEKDYWQGDSLQCGAASCIATQAAGAERTLLCMSRDSPSLGVGQGLASGCQALSVRW